MKRIGSTLGLLLLGVGAAALIWAFAPKAAAHPDIPGLQALATRSCRCARQVNGDDAKSACWSEFERRAARYRPRRYSTFCDPVSPSGYCFGDSSEDCVMKEYSVSPATASLCSLEEARIAEAAFEEAARRSPDDSKAPFNAFFETARALARGEKLAASPGSGGCAG